jgi:hypothetical protein
MDQNTTRIKADNFVTTCNFYHFKYFQQVRRTGAKTATPPAAPPEILIRKNIFAPNVAF